MSDSKTTTLKNILIINGKNEYFEYTAENDLDALDMYVEEKLGFESGFTVSKTFWNKLKDKIKDSKQYNVDDRVRLVNGFCKNRRHRIERVLTGYSIDYPILVRFMAEDGSVDISAYRDGVNMGQEAVVHYGDTLEAALVAPRGYRIESVSITDSVGNAITDGWEYDSAQSVLYINTSITSQIIVRVTTAKITCDWYVALWLSGDDKIEEHGYCVQDASDWTYQLDLSSVSWIDSADGSQITTNIFENGVLKQPPPIPPTTTSELQSSITVPNVHSHLYIEILYKPIYSS